MSGVARQSLATITCLICSLVVLAAALFATNPSAHVERVSGAKMAQNQLAYRP